MNWSLTTPVLCWHGAVVSVRVGAVAPRLWLKPIAVICLSFRCDLVPALVVCWHGAVVSVRVGAVAPRLRLKPITVELAIFLPTLGRPHGGNGQESTCSIALRLTSPAAVLPTTSPSKHGEMLCYRACWPRSSRLLYRPRRAASHQGPLFEFIGTQAHS